ncbi:MAG: 1-acyl-sn-glycerol-3-phosphate acyltransferase [Clostridiales bacterium]|nr:1-acyl-sn-glycerol-3-phosphate acyltransferase [Clostridiales bacterium]
MVYAIAKILGGIAFRLKFRIKVIGREHIPKTGGIILCANHASAIDPILIALAVNRKLRFIAKRELFRNKALAALISVLGAFPVDRETADITAYKTAINLLQNGEALLLFSQGTRQKTIDISNNKSGAAFFGIKARVPIIPIGITATYKTFSTVRVHIGRPISLDKYSGAKLKTELLNEVTEETMRQIIRLTGEK